MKKGKFIFEAIEEGSGESYQRVIFNPPLVVNYQIVEQVLEEGMATEHTKLMGFATFDFGMEVHIALEQEHNMLVMGGYEGLSAESDPIDILMKSLWFDLFHAFFHPSQDPNYSHYHWALQGWLLSRIKMM